jgi:hypothetical protein
MPRIFDEIVEVVVYIYDSLSDAQAGERQGGSGFAVDIHFERNKDWGVTYVITNHHVIQKAHRPVIRMNRKDGRVEYLETEKGKWFSHPAGDDIAALPIHVSHEDALELKTVIPDIFLTDKIIQKEDVGIGDDTFMVGRFINHEGKQRNAPAVRFGYIAMMPTETIEREDGIQQESFLVEMRSMPGYSGSPVFLFSTHAFIDFSKRDFEEEMEQLRIKQRETLGLSPDSPVLVLHTPYYKPKGPYLLGIDWCHLYTTEKVRDKNAVPIPEEWIVRSNSGMAGVIPAWKITELLNSEELVEKRRQEDEEITKKRRRAFVGLD